MSKRSWRRRIGRAALRVVVLVGFLLVGVALLMAFLRLMPGSVGAAPMSDVTDLLVDDPALAFESAEGPTEAVAGAMIAEEIEIARPAERVPDTFGDEPSLDELWTACESGLGHACDRLFQLAPLGSDYERFGLSCGERPLIVDCQAELDNREVGPVIDGWPLPFPLSGP